MADILVRDTRTGEVYPIPEDSAPELIRRGLVVPSRGETTGSGVGGAVHRFLESMASEGTFGASDIARRHLGIGGDILTAAAVPITAPMAFADLLSGQLTGEDIDAAQRLRAQEHPIADIGGRLAMGFGQAIATGGLSAEAGLGRTIAQLSPVGLAEAGGNLAARAIRGTISGRAGRIASTLGRFGVEGAIAGAEGIVTDANANDTPLTGEALVAGAGLGSLLGLGVGALGTGVSAGVRRLRAQRLANGSFGRGPVDRLLGRAQEVMGGVDRGIIDEMQDPARRALATAPETELLDISSRHASALQDISDARLAIRRSVETGAAGYRPHLATVNPELAQVAALSFLNDGIKKLRGTLATTPPLNTRGMAALLNRLRRTARRLLPSTTPSGATRAPRLQGAENIYREMDMLRETLGASLESITDPIEKRIADDVYHSLQGRVDDVGGSRTWVPGLLSDERIWGEAGRIQAANAQATSELINFERALNSRMQQRSTQGGEDLRQLFTTGKLRGALEYLGSQKGEDLHAGLLEWLDRQERLATIYRDSLGAGDTADALIAGIRRERADLSTAINQFEAVNAMKRGLQMEQRARGFGAAAGIGGTAVAGGLLGYSITGSPLAALPIAVGFAALTRPMLYYQFLATKDRVLGRVFGDRLSTALNRFRGKLRGMPVRPHKGFISPLVAPMVIAKSRKARDQEFDDRVEEIRRLQTNPQAVIEQVGDSLSDVSLYAPQTASYMHDAVLRGLEYLTAHLPTSMQNPLAPHLQQRRPSNTEQDNFLRVFRVVDDPLSAVEDLADLRLHPISARTLRDVYPEIFGLVQSEIVYELGELQAEPPYQVKINLGTLLQFPTDASLDPSFVQLMQSRAAQTTEQARTVGLSRHGARSGMSQRTMTETTSLMSPE